MLAVPSSSLLPVEHLPVLSFGQYRPATVLHTIPHTLVNPMSLDFSLKH